MNNPLSIIAKTCLIWSQKP